ncbi:MAG: hypothetical protein AVO35_08695 [Candidatus Aegiribacteria sp. MLS_C]|nr:MAG: hypothetical protein AVO35_08695 [Candidatus Aegiribacteria sp. MLS_C]
MPAGTTEPSHEGLFSFRIEFSIQCSKCDGHIPLDGPVEKAFCHDCGSPVQIPREYWMDTLSNSCRKMQDMEMGGGRGSILMGTFWGNLELARFDPYCDSCKTDIQDPWHMEPGTVYRCRKCGMEHHVEALRNGSSKACPG